MPAGQNVYTVFFADDNPADIKVVKEIIQSNGYKFYSTSQPTNILETIEKTKPDIILLDVIMPGGSGFDTCKKLKSTPGTGDIPIVFVTNDTDPKSIKKAFLSGGVDYIQKPIHEEELLARIRTHIALKESSKALEKELEKEFRTRKKTDEAFKASEQRYRNIYNNLAIGLFRVDKNGRYLMANPSMARIFKYLSAKKFTEERNLFEDLFHEPSIRKKVLGLLNEKKELKGFETNFTNIKLEKTYLRLSLKAFFNGDNQLEYYEGAVEDFTDARSAIKELEVKEKQFRLLFDNMINGFILQEMFVIGKKEIVDFYYLQMNKSLQKLMGKYYEPYKFIGRTMKEVPLGFDSEWFEMCKEVALHGKQFRFERYFKDIDKHFEMFLYQPQHGQVATIINDITSRKAAEDKIMNQSQIIAAKNKNITDSINVAERIQRAMLPKAREIRKHLHDYFVFMKPRDIVSGDFYWLTSMEDKTILAVADCTGHGVPGGYMSMVGHDMLNTIINLQGILEPDAVLTTMHRRIRQNFAKRKNDILDGMDIGICVIDKKNRTMEYAGAKMPLLYIQDGQAHKLKGDSVSLAVLDLPKKKQYNKSVVDISTETIIYLYSDGYQDQFGGTDRRKFLPLRFEKLLIDNHTKEFKEQKKILSNEMKSWMKGYDQLDDMLVIGAKIS